MKNFPELIIFDINETLLDLTPIKEEINQIFHSSEAFDLWFSKLLQFSLVESLTGNYRDFGDIGRAVLKMTAQKYSLELAEEKINSVLDKITRLKPYPEVKAALIRLKENGYKIVALTNGGQSTLKKQMENSGLLECFDALYSVESVQKFKPHPETYNYVLQQENVTPPKAMMIAAHAWDIVGAHKAGLQTAFLERPGKFLYPPAPQPELKGETLEKIAEALVRK